MDSLGLLGRDAQSCRIKTKNEEFGEIKPQMDADAPKGIENADKEG